MLVNIQVPSLAAYLPAYKILTIKSPTLMEVKTEVLNDVPHFDELFPLYENEYEALKKTKIKSSGTRISYSQNPITILCCSI